jgi:DNA polymerase III delta subunit
MITFYHGSDIYRIRAAVADLSEHALPRDMAIEADRSELERTLKYPSLFGQTTCVIVRNILADAATAQSFQELIERYDVSTLPDVLVIACHEGDPGRPSAASTALFEYLKRHAQTCTQFTPLTGAQRTSWIRQFCTDRQCTITTDATALMGQRSVGDSWALANDLEKLCAYAGQEPITPAMIGLLTSAPQERDEFALSNALAARDKRAALVALWIRLHQGTPGQLLLGALAHSIRTLLSVGDLASRNTSAETIAKTIGLPPFVVSRTIHGVSSYPHGALQRAHQTLAQLDRNTKNGAADLEDGLYASILNL